MINLIDTDAGRPLDHIAHSLQHQKLTQKVRRVLQHQSAFEEPVRTKDGHWYRMSIMVHSRANAIEEAVLTLVNLNALKKSASRT